MTDRLILAVPSKGRLQENAAAYFARAGLTLRRTRGERDYRGLIDGIADAEVAFLSASEIARELEAGAVHLGVTGDDLVQESIADPLAAVERITGLGFGFANVVVAVPRGWIDVDTMADLDDVAHAFRAEHGRRMRVATKYVNITRRWFDRHGVADYRIVESLGATEGTPAAGTAELIVDITTTGSTLAANDLKVLSDGVMLRSEAGLNASLAAAWPEPVRRSLMHCLDRVNAQERASSMEEVSAFWSATMPPPRQALVGEGRGVTILSDAAERGGPTTFLAPQGDVYALVSRLKDAGARTVITRRPGAVFDAVNPLLEKLLRRLAPG